MVCLASALAVGREMQGAKRDVMFLGDVRERVHTWPAEITLLRGMQWLLKCPRSPEQ